MDGQGSKWKKLHKENGTKFQWKHSPFFLMEENVITLNFGSRPRQGLQAGQEECERVLNMKTQTPKWTPILGVEVLMDSQTFREWLQMLKRLVLRSFLYHCKVIEVWMFQMGLHEPFGHLQHKLWQKERSRVKTGNLIPDHKKLRINSTSVRVSGMWYVIGQLSMRVAPLL
jgi:hypothetical protein